MDFLYFGDIEPHRPRSPVRQWALNLTSKQSSLNCLVQEWNLKLLVSGANAVTSELWQFCHIQFILNYLAILSEVTYASNVGRFILFWI